MALRDDVSVAVIVPALNEEQAIGLVLTAIPGWVDTVIVVDNGSTDRTGAVAKAHGATVVSEPARGYGAACLAGLAAVERASRKPDIVVFLDGDFSDRPGDMARIVEPIARGHSDLVIGSRVLGNPEPGSLTPVQRLGNLLAVALIQLFWDVRYTDLGPFRGIRYSRLEKLGMTDRDFGWTVEMQVKAARARLSITEVPVAYRPRVGTSKISGTLKGSYLAGRKILQVIFAHYIESLRKGAALPGRTG